MMVPAQEFLLFSRLPRELRLMVWDCFRETLPRKQHRFRIYFTAHAGLCRKYELLEDNEWSTTSTSRNIGTEGDPETRDASIPESGMTRTKIFLPGPITHRQFPQGQSWPPYIYEKLYVYVNFEVDLFSFDEIIHETHTYPNLLQFLAASLDDTHPADLESSHWFFRIRRLRLSYHPMNNQFSDFDRRTLLRHPCLKSLSINGGAPMGKALAKELGEMFAENGKRVQVWFVDHFLHWQSV